MKLTEYQRNSLDKLEKSIINDQWGNDSLVQIIELAGAYLNLQTISDYAKAHGITYNGAKKKNTIKIFNVKFVIEND